MRKIFLLLLLAIVAWPASWADDQELSLSGSGTETDPYQVASAADLQAIAAACNPASYKDASHYAGVYFKQTADIDMTGVEGFRGIGVAPEGVNSSTNYYFSGVYDGAGYKISNMKIDGEVFDDNGKAKTVSSTGSRRYVGLFGTIRGGAVIKNVTLDTTCTVIGHDYVGGIVGYCYQAGSNAIQNCKNGATVIGYYQYIGGIVGYARQLSATATCVIEDCVNTGRITSGYQSVGGIVGYCYTAQVIGCANEGTIFAGHINALYTSSFGKAGGVVGHAYNKAQVTDCVNFGSVKSEGTYTGGVIGYTSSTNSTFTRCANFGSVTGTDVTTRGSVLGSYYSVSVKPAMSGCYYDGQMGLKAVKNDAYDGVTALLTRQLTAGTLPDSLSADVWTAKAGQYPYVSAAKTADTEDWASLYFTLPDEESALDFSTSATLPDGVTATVAQGTGFEVSDGKIVSKDVSEITADVVTLAKGAASRDVEVQKLPALWSGSGTEADPYLISDAQDIADLATMTGIDQLNHYEGVYFKQTADIDASALEDFYGIAAADSLKSPEQKLHFDGIYDGQGHSVTLKINGIAFNATSGAVLSNTYAGSASNVGLFGTIGDGAVIKNVTVKGTVVGYSNVAGVVGYMLAGSSIDNVVNEASVFAHYNYAGGIAAYTKDTTTVVSNSRNKGAVISNVNYAAGIVACNYGTISNCQNDGKIVADYFEGATKATGNQGYAGGIAATHYGDIANCLNTGTVYASRYRAGGIVASVSSTYKGSITSSANLGNVSSGDLTTTGAIIGYVSSAISYSNVYFDSQISGLGAAQNAVCDGITDASTTYLTGGKVEGLDAQYWDQQAGIYPVLKSYNDAHSQDVASTYLLLPEGELSTNFKTKGTVSTAQSDITAALTVGTVFKLADGVVTASSVTEVAADTLTLTNGDFVLIVPLQKLPSMWDGSGTETDPYLIKTADDFLAASTMNSEANYSFQGEYFKVVADLDFTGKELQPLGCATTAFAGTFDGQGHTFKNVTYEATGEEGDPHTGIDVALFGYTGTGSVVKNIKLSDSKISGFKNIAGIVAQNGGSVTGCETSATVVLTDTVTNPKLTTANYLGGIVAVDNSEGAVEIRDCVNRASLTGHVGIGGIVAYSTNKELRVVNCQNYGDWTSKAVAYQSTSYTGTTTNWPKINAGGIAGQIYGQIDSCQNYGNSVTTEHSYIGGIAGLMAYTSTHASVTNCQNYGTITAGYGTVAGIVAYANNVGTGNTFTVADCQNYGPITAVIDKVAGGVVGHAGQGTRVSYCSNEGDVTLLSEGTHPLRSSSLYGEQGAGIVALISSSDTEIDHCWNSGHITGPGAVGGITGQGSGYAAVISNCLNVGTVENDSTTEYGHCAVAGISARGNVQISNCVNAGEVIGSKYVAGLVGYNASQTTSVAGTTVKQSYTVGGVKIYRNVDDGEDYIKYSGHVFGWANANKGVTIDSVLYLYDGQRYHVSGDSIFGLPVDSAFSLPASYATAIIGSKATLGDGYTYNDCALPIIKGFENLDVAKAYASFFEMSAGDCYDSITTILPLSQLEGVTWTATGALEINGSTAVPNALGAATLTATAGKFSKTYNLVVTSLPQPKGDLNGDGVVNTTDVTILVEMILSGETDDLADLNGDGVVNTTDLTTLINLILAQE